VAEVDDGAGEQAHGDDDRLGVGRGQRVERLGHGHDDGYGGQQEGDEVGHPGGGADLADLGQHLGDVGFGGGHVVSLLGG
jgi:hypothetical protein